MEISDRHSKHQGERQRLQDFASSFNLQINIPTSCPLQLPPPFTRFSGAAPISRLPQGECAEQDLPSLIDFSITSKS
eukprot:8738875-Karenia_brevis.AAC.1